MSGGGVGGRTNPLLMHTPAVRPSGQRHQVPRRYRRELSPEFVHPIAIDARRAVDEFRGVRHVLQAALVHEHGDVRMLAYDRSCGAGVIEVDVRQEDVTNIGPPDAVRLQAQFERLEAAGGTGIDDGHAAMTLYKSCGDDLWAATELQIDPRESMTECVHNVVPRSGNTCALAICQRPSASTRFIATV